MLKLLSNKCLWLFIFLWGLTTISTLPAEHRVSNGIFTTSENGSLINKQRESTLNRNDENKNVSTSKNTSDLSVAAAGHQLSQLQLPLAVKPRGFNLPKERIEQQKRTQATQTSAQNYYSNFFPDVSPLNHEPPYYSLAEDPIIAKFLSQYSKHFEPRQQPFAAHDASILGSGDFGILRGGTFYSDEEQSYANEEGSDFYYGDASNTRAVSSTEGFIQKYTHPEEQFAQFRDFADLGTPVDSAFSQYVVVYAAKNATNYQKTNIHNTKPKNIFEQLQEIDKEKALEQKKTRKNPTRSSITKLKLVKTKQMEKKWVQKQPVKAVDDDPLIALS